MSGTAADKARKDIDEAILEGYSGTHLLRAARSFEELADEVELNADSREWAEEYADASSST